MASRSSRPAAPRDALTEAGLAVTDVSAVTGMPEMMDGRVKTLHPRIHGGLLGAPRRPGASRRDAELGIEGDRLPGRPTSTRSRRRSRAAPTPREAIENIDIGGPAMIRAAAKNAAWVAVVTDPGRLRRDRRGADARAACPRALRARLAAKAFARTAAYDAAIAAWYARAARRRASRAPRRRRRRCASGCATARTRTSRPRSI